MENPYKLSPNLLKRFKQFAKINDNTKKFERIIELGKKLSNFPEEFRVEANQVKGCASVTYVHGELIDGAMKYQGDSNSHLVKGLVGLMVEGLSGLKPEEVLDIDTAFIEAMGLAQTLTASRANGFVNTINMMKAIAQNYQVTS